MDRAVRSWLLVIFLGLLGLAAWGCGDDAGTGKEDVSVADSLETDAIIAPDTGDTADFTDTQHDQVDPCLGVTQCAASGSTCDGKLLISCQADADGCLVETITDCGASNQVCDESATPARCAEPNPCDGLTLCATAGRTCDTTDLVVCAADIHGCLVESVIDCTAEAGSNTCLAASDPVACGFDPCVGVSDCGAEEATCVGDSLVVCAPDAFGCLVESSTDCTSMAGSVCDVDSCIATGACENSCAQGAACEGNTLVVCAPDAFGCPFEVRSDCTAVARGYCDATQAALCAIDTSDRCMGKALCTGTTESTTCAGAGTEDLVTCAYDALGCLVETVTDCSADPGQVCVVETNGERDHCSVPCADAPSCQGAAEGGASCFDNALYLCTDNDGDGCLELEVTDCQLDICNANTHTCDANGSGNRCTAPIVVVSNGQSVQGDYATVDFTNDLTFSNASCSTTYNTIEVVFEVALLAGETVFAQENGDFPATISFAMSCGNAATCALSESEGAIAKSYTASTNQTIFVVFEAQRATLGRDEWRYAFAVDVDPVCGNGLLEHSSERCDDGNAAGGDGCAADCTVELGWECGTAAGTSSCVALPHLGDFDVGDIIADTTGGPILNGEDDAYTITFLDVVRLSGTLGGFSTGEADLEILDQSGALVFSSASFGDESWTNLILAAGTYLLVIHADSGYGPVNTYTLSLSTRGVVCGDGWVEGFEACDDFNAMSGDGCASDCSVEPGKSCFGQPSVCFDGTGRDCASPVVLTGGFARLVGDIFAMGDAHDFTDPSCKSTAGSAPELLMEITLQPGEYVYCSEQTPIDGVLGITKTCSDAAVCVGATDLDETTGAFYANTSLAAEVVYCHFSKWSAAPTSQLFDVQVDVYAATCGDNFPEGGETCDDGNSAPNDGCSSACQVEAGWLCNTAFPNVCHPVVCGDDIAEGSETCDDGNTTPGDGCSASCAVDSGWLCDTATPNLCHLVSCGDGIIEGDEECEDGNTNPSDGCSDTCTLEAGWVCDTAVPNLCHQVVCGDGLVEGVETCDDGNTTPADGCADTCAVEIGYRCVGEPSTCAVAAPGEVCSNAIDVSAEGTFVGTTAGRFDDYDPGSSGCTGWAAAGPDMVYTLTLPSGSTIDATVTPVGWDAALYILTDCSDPVGSCVGGDDDDFSSAAESVRYANDTGGAVVLTIIVDGYSESGDYSLEIVVTP